MKKLLYWFPLILGLIFFAALAIAEQPQQQPQQPQPKNYQALIAQNGRAICEENLAQVLAVNDDLKTQIAALKAELSQLKKESK